MLEAKSWIWYLGRSFREKSPWTPWTWGVCHSAWALTLPQYPPGASFWPVAMRPTVPHHGVKICGLSCNRISQHCYVKICKEGNACSYKLQLIVVRYSLQFRLALRSSQTCADPRYSESKFWAAQQIFALRMTLPRADANKSSQVIHRTPGVMVATCWQIFPYSQVTDM
jgi:hypothetical protein